MRYYIEAYDKEGRYICGMNQGQQSFTAIDPFRTSAVKNIPSLLCKYKDIVSCYKLTNENEKVIRTWSYRI